MTSVPFIHIRSAKFPILPGEEQEIVNEGTYGKALALYLQTAIRELGYPSPLLCCEDWGWWVGVAGQPFTLGLCVYGFAVDGQLSEFCVCAGPEAPRAWSWKRFRFLDRTAVAARVHEDTLAILTRDPEIEVLGCPEDFPLQEPA